MGLHTKIALLALGLSFAACGESDPSHSTHAAGGAEGGAHEHEAQHGGLLVSLARVDDFAWAEVVFDPEVGSIELYLYGEHAEEPVRSGQESIGIKILTAETSILVQAQAVADVLTGETVGDTSHFLVEDERLKGLEEFEAKIERVRVLGQIFDGPRFSWPVDRFAREHGDGEQTELGGEGEHDGDGAPDGD